MLFGYNSKERYPMATRIKLIAPGDFLEITPGGAMVYDKLYGLQEQF
jgi:hypothetical protein